MNILQLINRVQYTVAYIQTVFVFVTTTTIIIEIKRLGKEYRKINKT